MKRINSVVVGQDREKAFLAWLLRDLLKGKFPTVRIPKGSTSRSMESRVVLGPMIRLCPGSHHAWYESNIGPVRKPIQ